HPHQRICKGVFKYAAIAVAGVLAEHITVMVILSGQSIGSTYVRHHPVVIGFLRIICAKIILRNMRDDSQWFPLAVLDQLHARMIFPCAERIIGLLRSIVVLLINKSAGIGDETAEQIRTEPAHGQSGSAPRTATHCCLPPWILGKGDVGVSGFYLGVVQYG